MPTEIAKGKNKFENVESFSIESLVITSIQKKIRNILHVVIIIWLPIY